MLCFDLALGLKTQFSMWFTSAIKNKPSFVAILARSASGARSVNHRIAETSPLRKGNFRPSFMKHDSPPSFLTFSSSTFEVKANSLKTPNKIVLFSLFLLPQTFRLLSTPELRGIVIPFPFRVHGQCVSIILCELVNKR